MDREKIMNGLQAIAENKACQNCCYPYMGHGVICGQEIARDAVDLLKEDCHNCKLECLLQKYDELKEKYDALLKEQEEPKESTPRLLTPEEVKTMKAGTPLVVERFIKHNGKVVPMACWAINTGSLILSFHGTMFPDTVHKIPYATIVQNREGKGHHNEYFRFWSDRPTKEQMEKEEWKGIEGDGC